MIRRVLQCVCYVLCDYCFDVQGIFLKYDLRIRVVSHLNFCDSSRLLIWFEMRRSPTSFWNTKVALAGSQRTTKDTKKIMVKSFIISKHPHIRETKGHEAPDGVVLTQRLAWLAHKGCTKRTKKIIAKSFIIS